MHAVGIAVTIKFEAKTTHDSMIHITVCGTCNLEWLGLSKAVSMLQKLEKYCFSGIAFSFYYDASCPVYGESVPSKQNMRTLFGMCMGWHIWPSSERTRRVESQLSAGYCSIWDTKEVITHCAPKVVVADLDTASVVGSSSLQSDISFSACCREMEA